MQHPALEWERGHLWCWGQCREVTPGGCELGEGVWEHTVASDGGEGTGGSWRETGSWDRSWMDAQGSTHLSSICWAT